MPRPERRTRWDLITAAALAVAVLAGSSALWWTSDARHTTLTTAPGLIGPGLIRSGSLGVAGPAHVPAALTEAWRAPSPATPDPLVQGGTVVTGAAGMVAGRDLRSGAVRWSYRRDRALCTVAAAFYQVLAVYQRGETCGEVTALDWGDGRRGPQRTGPVQAPTHLVAAGDQVAASGRYYLEVWRSDLVRTLAYGRLPTPAQPATQPRPDCAHGSIALGAGTLGAGTLGAGTLGAGTLGAGTLGDGELAVVEQCPGERVRLTLQRADPHDPDQPEVTFSTLLPGRQARVVAVSGQRVAVALPDPARLAVLDEQGREVA
ncbi:MAG: Rv3212 family protein, partial [Pseudonocardiaceae bacterium]